MQSDQRIVIHNKSSVEINFVNAVKSFDDRGIVIETELGLIAVDGVDLKIESLEKSTSEILITGSISGVYYLQKKDKKKGRGLLG